MACFLVISAKKKLFSILGSAHNDPIFVQTGSNKTIFKIYQLVFRTAGLQHKLLILIESPDIFH